MSEGTTKGLLVMLTFIGFSIMIGILFLGFNGSQGTILDVQRQICKNTPGMKDADCDRKFPDIDTLAGERYVSDVDDLLNKSSINSRYRSVVRQIATDTNSTIHITRVRYKGSGKGSDVWVNQEEGPSDREFYITDLVDDLPLSMREEVEESDELLIYKTYKIDGVYKQYLYIKPELLELIQNEINNMIQELLQQIADGVIGPDEKPQAGTNIAPGGFN